jgi:hypothetical protein
MRIQDIEPMVNMYPGSKTYLEPFGVCFRYADGHTKRFVDLNLALCANLTLKQRKYVKRLQQEIESCHARHR